MAKVNKNNKKNNTKVCGPKAKKKVTLAKRKVVTKRKDVIIKERVKMVTVVCGLREFFKQGQMEAYLPLIKRDVEIVSKTMYVYSIYLHFVFNKIISTRTYKEERNCSDQRLFNIFGSFREAYEFRHWLFELQGKAGFEIDPAFKRLMECHGLKMGEYTYTSGLFQETIKQYYVSLTNNLIIHMRKRLLRFLTRVSGDIHGIAAILTREEATEALQRLLDSRIGLNAEEKGILVRQDIEIFGVSFDGWYKQGNVMRYVPLLTKVQHMLFAENQKGFVVIPQCKSGLRKVLYTPTAFKELLNRRLSQLKKPALSDYAGSNRRYWGDVFDIEKYETATKKFKEILTDGFTCCVLLNKTTNVHDKAIDWTHNHNVSFSEVYSSEYSVPDVDAIYGFDPGMIIMLGGVKIDLKGRQQAKNFFEGLVTVEPATEEDESNVLMESATYRYACGYNDRKIALEKATADFERGLRHERELSAAKGTMISQKSSNYKAYVEHQLKHAQAKVAAYSTSQIARMSLDHYIRRQALLNEIVKFFADGYDKIAVFYGNSKVASCSPMKGHVRLPQHALYNAFENNDKYKVYVVDEFRSTKLCSKCYCILATKRGKKRYRRMVCPGCSTIWNRDVNAGRNIAMLGICKYSGHHKPVEFMRTRVVSLFE